MSISEVELKDDKLTKDNFDSGQEVRWCPGCGDYSILAAVQRFLPALGIPPEKYVFVSGIGCSSRFPYYMNTYGIHSIHGRAPAVATGVKLANPELSVWMISGDGDALSIGGNHLIHLLRRNPDIKVLLFNNRIYGLTKGQYSPTSEAGKITKSSPYGSVDHPLNPILVALGAEASFVARSLDVDAKHLTDVLKAASDHKGTAFIEIFQNCNIFNDGAWEYVSDRNLRSDAQIQLSHGELMIFGKTKNKGIKLNGYQPEVVEFEAGNLEDAKAKGVITYDQTSEALASIIARLDHPMFPVPMGVFYRKERATFEDLVHAQIKDAQTRKPLKGSVDDNLNELFGSADTWLVS